MHNCSCAAFEFGRACIVCRGTSAGLTAHFDELLAALSAPACRLRELRLVNCDWPKGRALSELVDALPAHGLKTLSLSRMAVGGAWPAGLLTKCADVQILKLYEMSLTGSSASAEDLESIMAHAVAD